MHCCLMFVTHSSLGKGLQWLFQTGFFTFGDKKKQSLVAVDSWSSYKLGMYGNFLGQGQHWSSDRGGRLNKFNCMFVFFCFFCDVFFFRFPDCIAT